MIFDELAERRHASAFEEALELLQRDGLTDVLEGPTFDVARLAHRQPQCSCGVREVVRVAVGEAHAQLEHLALGLGEPREHLLERRLQLRGRVVRIALSGLPAASAAPTLASALAALTLAALTALSAGLVAALALAAALLAAAPLATRTSAAALATVVGTRCIVHVPQPSHPRGSSPCEDEPRTGRVVDRDALDVTGRRANVATSRPPSAFPSGDRVYFVLVVVAIAVVASLLRGGRFHRLAKAPLEHVWLLFVGVALQVAADVLVIFEVLEATGAASYALLLASQLVIVAWAIGNWQLPGLALVAIGLVLNATVMAANGAMPVDPDAIAALGRDGSELVRGKHVLMDEDTRLPWLADIWPVPPIRAIISVGDVVLAAGLIPITHYLMTYRPPRERRRQGSGSATPAPEGPLQDGDQAP